MLRHNTFENKNYNCLTCFSNSRRWVWIVAAFFCLLPAIASGVELTLRWNPSFSPAVVGYNVYYGPDPQNYGDPIDAGPATELLISGLEENTTYHFAVTAYNSDYIESILSEKLTFRKIIPLNPGTITGIVRQPPDNGLDPAVDIAVCALDYDLGHWMGCTRTLSDGSYVIPGLPSGSYRVRVLSEDREYAGEYYPDTFEYSAAERVAAVEGTATEDIDFILSMGGVISGRTLGFKGSPIGNLLIYAEESTSKHVYFAETETDGTYALRALPSGDYRVRAETLESDCIREYFYNTYDGENADLVTAEIGRTTPDINFILAPGGRITGLVTRKSDDQPLAGLRVNASVYDSGSWAGQAQTGANGVFAINGLPTGTYRVRIETGDSDYIDQYYDDASDLSSALPVGVTANQTTADINFRLTEGGKITGKVVAESDDRPIAGLRLDAYDTDTGRLVESADTQSDGTYTISRLPSGSYRVRVETNDTDYLDAYYGGTHDPGTAAPVAVIVKETTAAIDISLIEGAKITGLVTRELDHQPLSDLRVDAYDDETGNWVGSAQTQPDGSFTIFRLLTGSYLIRTEGSDTHNVSGEYYENTYYDYAATPVDATVAQTTANIDFSLSAPATIDSDWDRATDVDEVNLYGTDPNDPDTDNDGIYDGDEVTYWTEKGIVDWSVDLDGDGLTYLLDDDSDGDGLKDGYESAGNRQRSGRPPVSA